MERVCIHEPDFLVVCSLVSGDDDEARGEVRVVLQQLAWGTPSHVHLHYLEEKGVRVRERREGRAGEEGKEEEKGGGGDNGREEG